jgi:hypothetical protein
MSKEHTNVYVMSRVGPIGGGICAAAIYGILSAQNDKVG